MSAKSFSLSSSSRQALPIILVLGAITIMPPLATDMYLSAFPQMAEHFNVSGGEIELSLSLFVIGMALGQIIYGPMADRFGRKMPLMLGIGLFALSSILIVFATDAYSFIGLRLLQAIGGCAGMVISRAIIDDLFSPIEGARVLSTMMLITGIGPILAPIIGSYLLTLAGWQSIFVVLFIFSVACLIATHLSLNETLPKGERVNQSLAGVMRVFWQLMTTRGFIVPALAGSIAFGGLFAFIAGSPRVFMTVFGFSQTSYGWLFALNAAGMIVGAQLNRFLLNRLPMLTMLKAGMLSYMLFASALLLVANGQSILAFMIPLVLCIAHIPIIMANATALAMSSSGANSGSASALLGVMQFGIAGIVSAIVGIFDNGTAIPMAIIIAATALFALLVFYISNRNLPSSN